MELACKNCKHWESITELKHWAERSVEPNLGKKYWIDDSHVKGYFKDDYKVIETKLFESGFGNCLCSKYIQQDEISDSNDTKNNGDVLLTKDNDEILLSASYSDSQGYFLTGKNFGCIHFKQR